MPPKIAFYQPANIQASPDSLPVARDGSRNSSALVGEERRGTAVFAGYFGSITNDFSGNAPVLLSRTGCCNLHNILKQFLNRFLVALFSPSAPRKKANRKNAKKRTLRELASIIANLHNLSSSVKIKKKLRQQT